MLAGDHTPLFGLSALQAGQARPIRVFALTTAGLETISAQEMAQIPGVTILKSAYRCITAARVGALAPLLALRTVDDIFVQAAIWTGIERQRSALERLRALSARLDLFPALGQCAAVRSIPRVPHFSLSISFVGKRNYTTDEMKAILAERIASRHCWTYTPDDRLADVNVRVFLDHEQGMVGLRLAKQPLHERSYRQAQIVGALKPSVAAAMARLAAVDAGTRVLDPCCGSGTLLIESALQRAQVCGGDSDLAAVQAARLNCQAAGIAAAIQQWRAERLPLASASVDRVISNLPWGRQTRVDGPLATSYRQILAEARRVLAPGGRVALLTSAPQEVETCGLACLARLEISLFGQRPTILVLGDSR
ncbi:MAG TPA: methyltransferase domain-containing protein [Ktedonobacterales bacterium]|nr:methyltransferase domain-containing protein [Ktedonobacterales bacterium]